MLKKLIKRIDWELKQAEDYLEQACIVKDDCANISELFVSLSKQEIEHAEKLMRAGDDYIEHEQVDEFDKEWLPVWKWIKRQSNERINDMYVIKNRMGGR